MTKEKKQTQRLIKKKVIELDRIRSKDIKQRLNTKAVLNNIEKKPAKNRRKNNERSTKRTLELNNNKKKANTKRGKIEKDGPKNNTEKTKIIHTRIERVKRTTDNI